ncbi:hypothetical protein AGMMS49545_09890 [Betaproteobacteria bacterium]|nr:hypothetical protein AGMMS49545_09890 [Betaproteobacteria bacterium]GHU42564.1 hypothetical protein AGMMS50289_07480 [Betaproteobacteria bacterium]
MLDTDNRIYSLWQHMVYLIAGLIQNDCKNASGSGFRDQVSDVYRALAGGDGVSPSLLTHDGGDAIAPGALSICEVALAKVHKKTAPKGGFV